MRNDAELVERRDKVSIVQLFVGRRALPASLARDVVATYYENATANRDLEAIFPALSSNLQVRTFARLHRIDVLALSRYIAEAAAGGVLSSKPGVVAGLFYTACIRLCTACKASFPLALLTFTSLHMGRWK
jgi:hypothetical protein